MEIKQQTCATLPWSCTVLHVSHSPMNRFTHSARVSDARPMATNIERVGRVSVSGFVRSSSKKKPSSARTSSEKFGKGFDDGPLRKLRWPTLFRFLFQFYLFHFLRFVRRPGKADRPAEEVRFLFSFFYWFFLRPKKKPNQTRQQKRVTWNDDGIWSQLTCPFYLGPFLVNTNQCLIVKHSTENSVSLSLSSTF